MSTGWIRRVAVIVTMAMTPNFVSAAPREPRWLTKTDAAVLVEVTMKTGATFDAIWMGRDGDRAVFQRLTLNETVSVPIDSVRGLRIIRGRSVPNADAYGALGAATGFWGGLMLLRLLLQHV